MILGISITIGGIFLYKSYAYYENEKEYNVIKGIIPDFSYDVKFAIEVDNVKQDNIPTTPKGTDKDKYYEVTATCDDGIKAEWDYNAWNLKVDNITKGTKCTLAFNSTLTEADYQKYIEAGVAYRRSTYRGKDITSKLKDGTLFSEIESGHFDDIFVGDYITSQNNSKVVWLIADLDNYMNTGTSGEGHTVLTKHHATIIPASTLKYEKMNSTDTTVGGYAGSEMVGYEVGDDGVATQEKREGGGTLDEVLSTYIEPDFGNNNPSKDGKDHIIEYSNMLTTQINETFPNRSNSSLGASSNWAWYRRKLDLMSEINVFGTIIWSSSGRDAGIDNKQYAIFKLKPEFTNSYNNTQIAYWFKDVANLINFVYARSLGDSFVRATSVSLGIRPRFLID